eukprot:m.232563 g.232563  ORF g.232563 m.232563 type:complete len:224 (-) comp16020_c0_seq5:2466-3137(-)
MADGDSEWTKHYDQNSRSDYYHNSRTGVTQWDPPLSVTRPTQQQVAGSMMTMGVPQTRPSSYVTSDGQQSASKRKRPSRFSKEHTHIQRMPSDGGSMNPGREGPATRAIPEQTVSRSDSDGYKHGNARQALNSPRLDTRMPGVVQRTTSKDSTVSNSSHQSHPPNTPQSSHIELSRAARVRLDVFRRDTEAKEICMRRKILDTKIQVIETQLEELKNGALPVS